jgi:GlcNAc-PI de-N-acetylase
VTIVFVLLTYGPDEPAGIERSIAALMRGLRAQGRRAHVLAAGPVTAADRPEIIRLRSLILPHPATEEDLLAAVAKAPDLPSEVTGILAETDAELVCWADATWGLGYLAPHPGITTALMVRVLRTDTYLHQALAHHPDHVLTTSGFLLRQAATAGLDTRGWHAIPNALLTPGTPPSPPIREDLRRRGPVRIVARAEPHKGIAELITACPRDLSRDVDIVLASAGFEYWQGMQREVITACQRLANDHPRVRLHPALPWYSVQPFLGGGLVHGHRLHVPRNLLQHRLGGAQRRHPGRHIRSGPRPHPDRRCRNRRTPHPRRARSLAGRHRSPRQPASISVRQPGRAHARRQTPTPRGHPELPRHPQHSAVPSGHAEHWRDIMSAFGLIPGQQVLVVATHPDDETLGCGGTIARLVAEGVRVHVLAVTVRAAPLWSGESTPATRLREFAAACDALGVTRRAVAWIDHTGVLEIATRPRAVIELIECHAQVSLHALRPDAPADPRRGRLPPGSPGRAPRRVRRRPCPRPRTPAHPATGAGIPRGRGPLVRPHRTLVVPRRYLSALGDQRECPAVLRIPAAWRGPSPPGRAHPHRGRRHRRCSGLALRRELRALPPGLLTTSTTDDPPH